MLPLLGALTLEAVESGLVANIIRYGLLTLGFSLASHQLKELGKKEEKKDVFKSKPKTDVFASSSSVSSKVSGSSLASSTSSTSPAVSSKLGGSSSVSGSSSASGDTEEGENGGYELPEVSINGNTLLDVLKNSGQATASNIQAVATSIGGLKGELRGIKASINGLKETLEAKDQTQKQGQELQFQDELLRVLKGLGAVLGGIGLGLEAIRLQLATGVNVDLPKEVKESSIATKKVMDKLTERVSINPEQSITEGTPIDFLTHSAGVQAKTFSDINSFDLDDDIPDWPNSNIDISEIFKFLRVSNQINQT